MLVNVGRVFAAHSVSKPTGTGGFQFDSEKANGPVGFFSCAYVQAPQVSTRLARAFACPVGLVRRSLHMARPIESWKGKGGPGTQAVTGPRTIDKFGPPEAFATITRDHVHEHVMAPTAVTRSFLAGCVLIGRRDTHIAEIVAFPGGDTRLFADPLWELWYRS